ncbi:hypothetical protein [Aurantibacillus circumpalustris]|uniref:hypothetical protein n=1 Tax=Aurantibacillus circumpalustris TaxID=3036359 RepID=UPI00295B51C0|nr:hypothetical protein [Aurantibacillus circumpalustris]
MRFLCTFVVLCLTLSQRLLPQMQVESIKITTTQVGVSAISVNSLIAKTYKLNYPLYDYKIDTTTKQLFFSGRQKGESGSNNYLSRGFFAALSTLNDSVKWINESSLYNIRVSGNNLLLSNEVKSVRYNKSHGYDEIRYDSKIFYTIPKYNRGFVYDKTQENVLNCVNLAVGNTVWSCKIPKDENWVDTQFLNDTTLLIAAGGLHAVSIKSGLVWSFPLTTAIKTNRSFIYSNAKFKTIQQISSVIKTSSDDNIVRQIASNILKSENLIYFAAKEKLIAVTPAGKMEWEVDLKNYPTSKMLITKTDSSLILVNFGLATHSNNFVTWGKPFIITLDPQTGKILNQYDLSHIENLADFVRTDKAFIFATKNDVQAAVPGNSEIRTVLSLGEHKYGEFVEFINGDEYYILREGYFVPLNFINDQVNYFRADNNKIYGIEGEDLKYEYHYTELFKLDKKYKGKTILYNDQKTLITNNLFELLFTINLPDKNVILNNKMFFMSDYRIYMLNLDDLK